MATLTLDTDFRTALGRVLGSLPTFAVTATNDSEMRRSIDGLRDTDREHLNILLQACRGLLAENGWVHIRSLPEFEDARAFHTIGHGLGELFRDLQQQSSIVVEARPGIGQSLQGCQTRQLPLHTDFAMLERPPAVTMIHCREADPAGAAFVTNGVADMRDILSRHFGDPMLDTLRTLHLPFAGRKPNGEDVLIERSIIEDATASGPASLRFHPSRIHHGFRVRGRPPSAEEAAAMRNFLFLAESVRTNLCLAPGDALLVDNRRVLHDRSRCTLQLGSAGHRARVAHVLFVQDLWPT